MARNFRQLLPRIVPSWLSEGEGGTLLYVCAVLLDVGAQRVRDSLEARFPRRAGASALALIGADRGLYRGRLETAAHFAERLVRWRWPRGHRVRGNAVAWLEQISAYFGGLAGYTIDVNGNRSALALDGTATVTHGQPWTWDAGASLGRARFWTVLDGRAMFSAHPLDWDDAYGGTWDPGSSYTIGQLGALAGDADALRRMLAKPFPWKPAGSRGEWLVMLLDAADVTPDATWARWSRIDGDGLRVETRSSSARYWRLNDAVNTYAGDPTLWSGGVLPGSGLYYEGDPTSWPASATGPDGTVYTGDPASWPASALLPDDGDHL